MTNHQGGWGAVKLPGCEADHHLHPVLRLRTREATLHSPMRLHGVAIS